MTLQNSDTDHETLCEIYISQKVMCQWVRAHLSLCTALIKYLLLTSGAWLKMLGVFILKFETV